MKLKREKVEKHRKSTILYWSKLLTILTRQSLAKLKDKNVNSRYH